MKGKISNVLSKHQQTQAELPRNHGFDDDDVEFVNKKGLKINNEKSDVKLKNPLPNIKKMAEELLQNENLQMKISVELTSRFLTTLKNKTLDENKNTEEREEEKRIVSEYAAFAKIINADPNQQDDGVGTLSLVVALARCFFIQRDRINELEYEIVKLSKLVESKKASS